MARGTRTQGGRRTRICACANCGRGRPLVILPRRAETSLCPTFTIAHVNATHPSSELDVASVLSKNLAPVYPVRFPTVTRSIHTYIHTRYDYQALCFSMGLTA